MPYQRLKEEGYEVRIAEPSKKLRFVVHDIEPGYDTLARREETKLVAMGCLNKCIVEGIMRSEEKKV